MPNSPLKDKNRTEVFADAYVKNGMNATQSYLAISPMVKETTANVEGSKYLRKPKVIKAIADRMPSDSRLANILSDALNEKPKQDIDWSTKHKYLTTALKLKGYLSDTHNTQVNVGLFTSKD